jgi:hypothetical protein
MKAVLALKNGRLTLRILSGLLFNLFLVHTALAEYRQDFFHMHFKKEESKGYRVTLECAESETVASMELPVLVAPAGEACSYYQFFEYYEVSGQTGFRIIIGRPFSYEHKKQVAESFKDWSRNSVGNLATEQIFYVATVAGASVFPSPLFPILAFFGGLVDVLRLPYSLTYTAVHSRQARKLERRLRAWSKGKQLESTEISDQNYQGLRTALALASEGV